jgi:hypothetical protein
VAARYRPRGALVAGLGEVLGQLAAIEDSESLPPQIRSTIAMMRAATELMSDVARPEWSGTVAAEVTPSCARPSRTRPQIMAALRNLAITALRLDGITAITAAMRDHARNPDKPLATYKII